MSADLDDFSVLLQILEDLQANIGSVQAALYEWRRKLKSQRKAIDHALIKLESAQRDLGSVQVALLDIEPTAEKHQRQGTADVPPEALHGLWTDLHAWLKERKFHIIGSQQISGLDAAADRAALYLGKHFDSLGPFYEAIKRRIAGDPSRRFSVRNLPGKTINDITKLGQMLFRCGFFSEFKYIRHDQLVVFDVQDDGRVKNFLTGDWLERYVIQTVRNFFRTRHYELHDQQILHRVQGVFDDGRDAEFDILIALPQERVLWIECKTGDWQSYLSRLRHLNQRYLKMDPSAAALVIVESLSDDGKGQRQRARRP